jgi:uncharacterized protein
MINIGRINRVKILEKKPDKTILDGDEFGEILLAETEHDFIENDLVDVFIYTVTDGELRATFQKPLTMVNQFSFLKVKDINDTGAFLDWGIEKDLFLPYRNQKEKLQIGEYCIVYTYLDEISQRIVSSSKIDKYIKNEIEFAVNQKVEVLAYSKTDLGVKCIINNSSDALLFHNDIFNDIEIGTQFTAYIKQIRSDGKIDLMLSEQGQFVNQDLKSKILSELEKNSGVIYLGDKSEPKEIYNKFSVSKAQYKKAIGSLYKDKKIILSDKKISLT